MTVHRAWHHAEATWHAPSLWLVHRGGWRRPPLGPLHIDTSRWPKSFETSHFTAENSWKSMNAYRYDKHTSSIIREVYIKMLEYKIHVRVLLGLKFGLIPGKCAGRTRLPCWQPFWKRRSSTDWLLNIDSDVPSMASQDDILRPIETLASKRGKKKKLPRPHGNTFD